LLLQPSEIDRLGDELGSAEFAGAAAAVVALRGDHHHREIGEAVLISPNKVSPSDCLGRETLQ
jgi:hypothetical protein